MFVNLSKNKNASEMIQYLKKYTSMEFQKDSSVLGLVCESHFLDLSSETKKELKRIEIPKESYVFLLCVSKGIPGNSMASAYQILKERGIAVDYSEHIVLGEDLQAEASFIGEKKSKEAERMLERFAKEIEAREKKPQTKEVSIVYVFLARLLRLPRIHSFLSKSLDSNRCKKCGHCRGVCPTQKKFRK